MDQEREKIGYSLFTGVLTLVASTIRHALLS